MQIDKAQDLVQLAKDMLAQKSCAAYKEQLVAARQKRDEQQGKLVALLMARELIANSTHQVKIQVGFVVCPNYVVYASSSKARSRSVIVSLPRLLHVDVPLHWVDLMNKK